MSVKKDSYTWLWVGVVTFAITALIISAIFSMMRPKTTLHLGDGIFTTSIARTDLEHEKGLSGIKSLAKDQAMLFVFSTDGAYSVWMKDMKIPIDAVWLDSKKKVVHLEKNLQPSSYPTTYKSKVPARYIVELPAGTIASRSIKVGSVAQFDEEKAKEDKTW